MFVYMHIYVINIAEQCFLIYYSILFYIIIMSAGRIIVKGCKKIQIREPTDKSRWRGFHS